MTRMQTLMGRLADSMHDTVSRRRWSIKLGTPGRDGHDHHEGHPDQMRDHIADFDDEVRPIRNYFIGSQTVSNIPACSGCVRHSMRSTASTPSATTWRPCRRAWTPWWRYGHDGRRDEPDGQRGPAGWSPSSRRSSRPPPPCKHDADHPQQLRRVDHPDAADDRHRDGDGEAFDASKSDDYFICRRRCSTTRTSRKARKLFPVAGRHGGPGHHHHDVDPATEAGISTVDEEVVAAHEAIKAPRWPTRRCT